MPSITDAYTTLQGILNAAALAPPIRWHGDDTDSLGAFALPDTPAPFLFGYLETDPGEIAGFGGGRGANLYRNPGYLYVYAFVPRGDGAIALAMQHGESVAILYRSYRDSVVSVFEASVLGSGLGSELRPPGLQSSVNAYTYALVEVMFFYDQVG